MMHVRVTEEVPWSVKTRDITNLQDLYPGVLDAVGRMYRGCTSRYHPSLDGSIRSSVSTTHSDSGFKPVYLIGQREYSTVQYCTVKCNNMVLYSEM